MAFGCFGGGQTKRKTPRRVTEIAQHWSARGTFAKNEWHLVDMNVLYLTVLFVSSCTYKQ